VGSSGAFTVTTRNNVALNKSGYLYVYISNETPNIDVFFDNLQVTHLRGPLVEEAHYYPFGLTMAGISSKALNFGKENKFKYNSGTELSHKEFSDCSGLEIYETSYRGYDPQIGRFWQPDPLSDVSHTFSSYAYANNNPICLNDPSGLLSDTLNPVVLQDVTVKSKMPKNLIGRMAKSSPNATFGVGYLEGLGHSVVTFLLEKVG
jgi:RHS repeat-associated protein